MNLITYLNFFFLTSSERETDLIETENFKLIKNDMMLNRVIETSVIKLY